jgi:glycosyltransferase involved in cell wall biosynthesis
MHALNNYLKSNGISQNVVFTGEVSKEQLLKFYRGCDVFVLPSLAELFPAVVLEAMASCKPVIATNVGAISIQIKDGFNGFIVEPANENSLAEKIKVFMDDPSKLQFMGINSRKRAEEYFDWKKVANKISVIYEGGGI